MADTEDEDKKSCFVKLQELLQEAKEELIDWWKINTRVQSTPDIVRQIDEALKWKEGQDLKQDVDPTASIIDRVAQAENRLVERFSAEAWVIHRTMLILFGACLTACSLFALLATK